MGIMCMLMYGLSQTLEGSEYIIVPHFFLTGQRINWRWVYTHFLFQRHNIFSETLNCTTDFSNISPKRGVTLDKAACWKLKLQS